MFLSIGLTGCGGGTTGNSESLKNSESTQKPESNEPASESPDESNEPASESIYESESESVAKFEIISPKGTVYSYNDAILKYLNAGTDADVADYATPMDDQAQSVLIEWNDNEEADEYIVEYSSKEDFSDAITEKVQGTKRRLKVYNLYKASAYYLRITAKKAGAGTRTIESTFKTQTVGPRVMKIGGLINVRDVGGYTTESGKTVQQGLIFRGSCLSPSKDPAYANIQISDDGKEYLSETLKIKSDFDMRSAALYPNLTESPIPNAKITFFGISGYADAFGNFKDNYRKLFSAFADKNNYPVYIHCDAGADRTGTAILLLEYLLGMKESDIKHDYEFTTFSRAGLRSFTSGAYVGYIDGFYEGLQKFDGDTWTEKVENYLLSIGVTADEIANIRSIMYGETAI